jgi:2-polyprenyl-6-methoxyphenol hydroxylase-like FAD-dependent oxidoreductase
VSVERGTDLVNFEQTSQNVIVHLRGTAAGSTDPIDETVIVQYLVGADGGRSTVRKMLGLAFLGESRAEAIIYGDVIVKGIDPKVSHMEQRHSLF